MNDDPLWTRIVAIEWALRETSDIPYQRVLYQSLFDLLHEEGHDDLAEAMQNTIAYRVFEMRSSLWDMKEAIIESLPRPLRRLIRWITA